MEHHPVAYLSNLQSHGRTRGSVLFHRKRFELFKSFYYRDLTAHYGCVNALEFSIDGNFLASGGDDKRVVLWDISCAMLKPNYRPVQLAATHLSNIFCLAFSKTDDSVISSGNDGQVIVHDLHTRKLFEVFMYDSSIYGLSASSVEKSRVAAACEDGTVFVMDTRLSKMDSLYLARRSSAFHSVMFSPVDHHLLATSHSRDGAALWDIRSPKREVLLYGHRGTKQSAMSVRFNRTGNQLLCLRRRQPVALFSISDVRSIAEFECDGYSNSCTMKSCCFAGDKDQYVVSGSEDFGIYIWKIPEYCGEGSTTVNNAFKILRGHRSIVNQVRFNYQSNLLFSSGVEKVIKLWSTEQLPHTSGGATASFKVPRKRYSHNEYIQLVLESSSLIHDYQAENTEEDPKMLAFFDSLVQHEADVTHSDLSSSDAETTTDAQGNRYLTTEKGNVSSAENTSLDEDDDFYQGPASLEALGISGATAVAPALSEAAQKRLRKLRIIMNEETDWRLRDLSTEQTVDPMGEHGLPEKIFTPKMKKRKKDGECFSAPQPDSSDSEDDAARIRQRNARRRLGKQPALKQQSSSDATPSTSGLCSSKSDSEMKVRSDV